jgi:mannose-1-phosphate guanylyltransferase
MVPVLNIPFLEHVIRNLKAHDITEIVLAQYYLAESMQDYFGDGSKLGVNLYYVLEDSPRGTAGAVKNVEKYLGSTFLVLNGDIFHNRDFTDMLGFHRRHRAKVTIALSPVEDPTIYGVVETDPQASKKFSGKTKLEEVTTNMINADYVLNLCAASIPPVQIQFEVSLSANAGGGRSGLTLILPLTMDVTVRREILHYP